MLVFDYGYDSGEEWEDEGGGEADDVVEDGDDDDDADADDADSDLDTWLVDDDDVQEVGTPLEERDASPLLADIPLPVPAPKRKSEDTDQKLGKKRKVVVPLIPFAKGPCWESRIGRCEYDLFKPYRIQLFNGKQIVLVVKYYRLTYFSPDTPYPIDPFTFVSECVPDRQPPPKDTPSSNAVFAVPPLPERFADPNSLAVPSVSLSSAGAPPVSSSTNKRTVLTPKTSFPEAHIPFLLTKITSLATGSITFLVETVYQELRAHKVKKNAIEAKIKEVGEKCKEKKVWVIKEEVRVSPAVSLNL